MGVNPNGRGRVPSHELVENANIFVSELPFWSHACVFDQNDKFDCFTFKNFFVVEILYQFYSIWDWTVLEDTIETASTLEA